MRSSIRVMALCLCLVLMAHASYAALMPYLNIKGVKYQKRVTLNDDGTFTIPALPAGDYTFTLTFAGKKGYDTWTANVSRVKVRFHWDRTQASAERRIASSGGDSPKESRTAAPVETTAVDLAEITPTEAGELTLGPVHLDSDGKSDFAGTVMLEGKAHKHIAGVKYED